MINPITSFPPVSVQPFEGVNTNINEENRTTLTNEQLQEASKKENIQKINQQNEKRERNEVNLKDFEKLSDKLNELLKSENLAIEFSIDKDTKKMIMKIIDNNTKEILQQIPPEIAIKIARIVARTLAENSQIADTKI